MSSWKAAVSLIGLVGIGCWEVGGSAATDDGIEGDPASTGDALTAIGANGTVGLDWPRVAGARSYRIYWAHTPGVTPADGQRLDSAGPAPTFVHRGLTNGQPHHYVVTAVTDAGELPPSAEVSATPGGEWVLEELGAGDFDDVVTGERVPRLPVKDRVHVLLLPEGYLAGDLPQFHDHVTHTGRQSDVDRWVDELFRIDPYAGLRDAFVIWYLPRPSPARVGAGRTAFDVEITPGAGVRQVRGAAARVWGALDASGTDGFPFPPGEIVRNHVAAFLIFDPQQGRAGISGVARTLPNPARPGQVLRAAFGVGHAHEFTHAFSDLRDEYLEDDNTARSTAPTSNVVARNRCDELPWAHLLEGRGINHTAGVVGAFGRPTRGYHPELRCLMNGTHENAKYYCPGDDPAASLNLRAHDCLCNFCREMTAYRVFERTGMLTGVPGFTRWKDEYRPRFYERFGFQAPRSAPQPLACTTAPERPVFEDCVP